MLEILSIQKTVETKILAYSNLKILWEDLFQTFPQGVLVCDETVKTLYESFFREKFFKIFSFPSGEIFKSAETAERLEKFLRFHQIGRDGVLIALGGGVVSDLVGFVASTYCRGIDFVVVPTTLLGMVDAGIGGKTAINVDSLKNRRGTFHFPKFYVLCTEFLKTLPEKELKNGLSEICKYGLIYEKKIFYFLEKFFSQSNLFDLFPFLIQRSVETKIKIVKKDPFEKNVRSILNFGHTFAHAMESFTNYQMSHGEAVALGLYFETILSCQMKKLSCKNKDRICSLLKRMFFSSNMIRLEKDDAKILKEKMTFDKKAQGGVSRFVVLKSIGKVFSEKKNFFWVPSSDLIDETFFEVFLKL